MDEAAGMLALHAAVKAELGDDVLRAGGGALVAPALKQPVRRTPMAD